ncbi:MAG: hypothetical protein IH589_07380 [Anaerolineales bacterium]|nr:hypothetical protein [Anaerolineales bacterium]
MKKIFLLLFCFASSTMLAACSSQVTVTSEVTVTLPPTATVIPTPTLHPQFIALQESIAASGERFTLMTDGTVQDGGVSVPGLQVDPKGVMTIDVNGEDVVVDPSAVHLGPDGVQVDGYELNDDGEWVEALLRLPNGVGLEFDESDTDKSDGQRVDRLVPPDDLNYKEKLDWTGRNNPETYGFEAGDTQWVYKDGKLVLQDANDPSIEIAEMGNTEIVWDWSKMVDENGQSVLLSVGKLVEFSGGVPVDRDTAHSAFGRLMRMISEEMPGYQTGSASALYLATGNGKEGLVVSYYLPGESSKSVQPSSEGYICFMDKDGRTARYLYARNVAAND